MLTASSVSLTLIPVVVLTISLRITSPHVVCWFGLDCCTYWDCEGVTKRGRNHTCENKATAHHFTAPKSQNTFSVCSTTPNSQQHSAKSPRKTRKSAFILSRQRRKSNNIPQDSLIILTWNKCWQSLCVSLQTSPFWQDKETRKKKRPER